MRIAVTSDFGASSGVSLVAYPNTTTGDSVPVPNNVARSATTGSIETNGSMPAMTPTDPSAR